ncbi:hypothetical protein [Streptomyces sp. YIM 121038]|uniref:hypothetical protein n=1 Tax=Streptomyces sp. YIM 121038 TaxID=2136401 RepID=UPI001110921B|nr:hypothetical protein [Streptomyces sp. YIM 121038]
MSARDELFLHLPDTLWLSKRDALLDAYRAEVLREAAVMAAARSGCPCNAAEAIAHDLRRAAAEGGGRDA